MPPLNKSWLDARIKPGHDNDMAVESLEVHTPVEQHRSIFPIGHAERLGAGKPGEGNLARRRLPSPRVSLFPAELPPVGSGIERRPTVVADAGRNEKRAWGVGRHIELACSDTAMQGARLAGYNRYGRQRAEDLSKLPLK